VVIADFYVPYLCCSDCAPVAYIVTQLVVAAEFSIAPNEFLFDDPKDYPFVAKPPVTNANKGQTPFTSVDIVNPGNLNIFTDDTNVLFLHPAMPELEQTLVTTITYKHVPLLITVIKPDAAFTMNITSDDKGNKMLKLVAVDINADTYAWKLNDNNGIIENTISPAALNIQELSVKLKSTEFNISLTVSYTRNGQTSNDTKTQVYNVPQLVCIDFEAPDFVIDTKYAPESEFGGNPIFTTKDKVDAIYFPLFTERQTQLGTSTIAKAPDNFNSTQCLSLNNSSIAFDYSNSGSLPSSVTVDFLNQGGTENLSVNGSKTFIGDLSKPPAELGGVGISVVMGTGDDSQKGILILTGTDKAPIKTFLVGGQEFFIDNVCAEIVKQEK